MYKLEKRRETSGLVPIMVLRLETEGLKVSFNLLQA